MGRPNSLVESGVIEDTPENARDLLAVIAAGAEYPHAWDRTGAGVSRICGMITKRSPSSWSERTQNEKTPELPRTAGA